MQTPARIPRIIALTSVSAVALTACGGSAGGDDGGDVTLRFTWWGSDSLHSQTQEIIDAYEEENPEVTIEPEYGEWSGYWDQLATQTAAGDAPDIIQMDGKYLREYADRGALLELSDVETSELDQDVIDAGSTEDGLFGITTGVNALSVVANPALFEEAGLEMPDDTTWTWEDFAEISAKLSATLDDGYGATSPNEPGGFQVWLRQEGKHLTTDDGELGFEASDVEEYFAMYRQMVGDGLPSASAIAENQSSGSDQSLMGTGRAALSAWWSNQLPTLADASGEELELLRYPSRTGSAEDNGMWYKSTLMISGSSGTEHPEVVRDFIDYFINSQESGAINGVDRGIPANASVLESVLKDLKGADARSADFIESIEGELAGGEPVPALGFSALQNILYRYETEVFFERLTPKEAAEQMIPEMQEALGR